MLLVVGCTTTLLVRLPTCPAVPICRHVEPASEDLKTPTPPYEGLHPGVSSPVPAWATLPLLGAMATPPIARLSSNFQVARQVSPPLVDFHTPPFPEPRSRMSVSQ